MKTQTTGMYLAGMHNQAMDAQQQIQQKIDEGWLVLHLINCSSGNILVVYEKNDDVITMPTNPRRSFGL